MNIENVKERYKNDDAFYDAIQESIEYFCRDCKGGSHCGQENWFDCAGVIEDAMEHLKEKENEKCQ